MKGFDPRFADLPDYILKITKEIWEERGIATLHHYYAKDMALRSTSGLIRGSDGVIADTLATLSECPDRRILGEDVIWSGDEASGFLSSHRAMTLGTHTGHGAFGPPTNRSFAYRAIADCVCRDDVIHEEWLVRDDSAIAIQLGFDPVEEARAQILREGGPERATPPLDAAGDTAATYTGRGNDDEWGERLEDILERLMAADVTVIRKTYDRAATIAHPGTREGFSFEFAETEWMRLRSAFPSARFSIDHRIGRSDPGQPNRAAVRWSLTGSHDGHGAFGPPTGASVHVMGITHVEFGPYGEPGWGVRREWTVFDEVAVWKQILLHGGRV